MPLSKRSLTPEQICFIDEYLRTSNATQSYLHAYYFSKQKQPPKNSVARAAAHQVLSGINVQTELKRKSLEVQQTQGIASPIEVLQGYTKSVRFDPGLLVDQETGKLLPVHKLPDEVRLELAGMEYSEVIAEKSDGSEQSKIAKIKYKFPDKTRVRDSLCRVFNIGTDGNGMKKLLLDMLAAQGLNVTINQTYNDNRQQQVLNVTSLQGLLEDAGAGAADR
jgi:phage terminase small subunit